MHFSFDLTRFSAVQLTCPLLKELGHGSRILNTVRMVVTAGLYYVKKGCARLFVSGNHMLGVLSVRNVTVTVSYYDRHGNACGSKLVSTL